MIMNQSVEQNHEPSKIVGHHPEQHVAVAVITTAGVYPDAADYRKAEKNEKIAIVLQEAARHFGITNTTDWVAHVDDRELNINLTFEEENLCGVVEIEYHKRQGGGGRA
jgi:hypothetical protein